MTSDWLTEADLLAIPAQERQSGVHGEPPVVSVIMIAYRHRPYIAEAIESIATQHCDAPFEILIGDDASDDGTQAIIERFAEQYPDRIRMITSAEQVGMHKNFARLWVRARGEFITVCEGDDYWQDRGFLQARLDWMRANPTVTLCGALTRKIAQDEKGAWVEAGQVGPAVRKARYTIDDLIRGYTFHTSSVMIRAGRVRFPRWLWSVYCVDRPLYILCAQQGEVGLVPTIGSTYRLHGGGIWAPVDYARKAQSSIELFEQLHSHLSPEHRQALDETLSAILWSYLGGALQAEDRRAAVAILRQAAVALPVRLWRRLMRHMPSIALQLAWPSLYHRLRPRRPPETAL